MCGLSLSSSHETIVIADLKGLGVIRHIRTTRHYKRPISARGVVLLIYFDGVKEPLFKNFHSVIESNNGVDIDGPELRLVYLELEMFNSSVA